MYAKYLTVYFVARFNLMRELWTLYYSNVDMITYWQQGGAR